MARGGKGARGSKGMRGGSGVRGCKARTPRSVKEKRRQGFPPSKLRLESVISLLLPSF
jgi:hypothetical protein